MENEVYYYIEDDVNDTVRAPKIIRKRRGHLLELYDYRRKVFFEDINNEYDLARIYIGSLLVSSLSEQKAYEAIEKYTKRFYS